MHAERSPRERADTRRGRAVLFRVVAVWLGLSPLAVSEATLRAFDLGNPPRDADPFLGFTDVEPLFRLDAKRGTWTTAPTRRLFFRVQSFPARKVPGTFRVFCLGGSTVQGRPYSVETSFTTWLELSLQAADPSRRWEVINCGGVSYASYRLVPILQEVLGHEPDLIVLYTGQNEFLESRTYPRLTNLPGAVRSALGISARLRTFEVLRQAIAPLLGRPADPIAAGRPVLGSEVDARLDYENGLAAYHRDLAWRRGVVAHFAYNLRRMIAIADDAGVPVLLANPAVNLETPPFKSEHRPGLSEPDLARFDAAWSAARSAYGRSLSEGVAHLERAIAIDDQHAGVWYALGKAQQDLGRPAEARVSLQHALNLDICPLRILGSMNALILRVARETGTPLVDVRRLFAGRSPGGVTGANWLVDHVHPSIAGHQVIASMIVDEMADQGWLLSRRAGWEAERDRLYAERLATLDILYYHKAEQRLSSLEAWARGRSTRLRSQGPIARDLPDPAAEP